MFTNLWPACRHLFFMWKGAHQEQRGDTESSWKHLLGGNDISAGRFLSLLDAAEKQKQQWIDFISTSCLCIQSLIQLHCWPLSRHQWATLLQWLTCSFITNNMNYTIPPCVQDGYVYLYIRWINVCSSATENSPQQKRFLLLCELSLLKTTAPSCFRKLFNPFKKRKENNSIFVTCF